MNHKLIKVAILFPHAFPWNRENLSLEEDEMNKLLESYNLGTEIQRRIAGWKIKFTIFKLALSVKNYDELLANTVNSLKSESYCSEFIIRNYVNRLQLENKENLSLFTKFINKEVELKEVKDKINIFIIWVTEAFAYHSCSNSQINSRELQDKITNYLNRFFDNSINYNEMIKNQMYKSGLIKNDILELFSKSISQYKNEIETVFGNFINKESAVDKLEDTQEMVDSKDKIEGHVSDSILSLFNNSTTLKLNEEEINEISQKRDIKNQVEVKAQVESVVEENNTPVEKELIKEEINNDEENNNIFNNLKALANTLGYEIANKEEMVLSKDKYSKLVDSSKEKEIELLKELALLKNGAILSELYNVYKNINEISKENLEAVLTNFFFTLSLNGFEVMDDRNKVGDIVKVNTNKVLREFLFTEAINKEGQVDAKIEYLGWKYKGKQVVPMSVKALD